MLKNINIKKLAKRSRTIVRLNSYIQLLREIPLKDLRQINKLRLFSAVKPYTMLGYLRLSKLYELASNLEERKIPGSFVECGVWNGGSAGIISTVANKFNSGRIIWLFDSFEGLPEPTESDVKYNGKPGRKGMALGQEEKVKELLFTKLKLNPNNIQIKKGWFEDTIPKNKEKVGKIALLHLDCDWYESVKFCLNQLYDNVVAGGFIIIDDYGSWKGCKKAVDEFIKKIEKKIEIIKIDYTGIFFQKIDQD